LAILPRAVFAWLATVERKHDFYRKSIVEIFTRWVQICFVDPDQVRSGSFLSGPEIWQILM
jgi:hypothetical protein